jgi:hypothetical protein
LEQFPFRASSSIPDSRFTSRAAALDGFAIHTPMTMS